MIHLKDINKSYESEIVLKDVSFSIDLGITLSITGKSGGGKTTLLKIMAGLIKADSGSFSVNGIDLLNLPIQQRKVLYLAQEPLLFPHLNVFENIAYGLRIKKLSQAIIKEKVFLYAEKVGVLELIKKSVTQLSGGQKQRVNFARCLIIEPNMLLLDEPFGSLDNETRNQMHVLFKELTKDVSVFFVTHDIKEAIVVGDKYAKIQNHKIKIFDTVNKLINQDANIKKEMSFWENLGKL